VREEGHCIPAKVDGRWLHAPHCECGENAPFWEEIAEAVAVLKAHFPRSQPTERVPTRRPPRPGWPDLFPDFERDERINAILNRASLTGRMAVIVVLRHGLWDGEEWTFEEIAKFVGSETSNVCRSYWRAIERIKSHAGLPA
jgi:hypothetical protein